MTGDIFCDKDDNELIRTKTRHSMSLVFGCKHNHAFGGIMQVRPRGLSAKAVRGVFIETIMRNAGSREQSQTAPN